MVSSSSMIKVIVNDIEKIYATTAVLGEQLIKDMSHDLDIHDRIIALKNIDTNELIDLQKLIHGPANITTITIKDKEYLEILRHDCEHVLAQAVQELFPQVKLSVGAEFANGFGYDFYTNQPFTWEDIQKIEQRMHEIVDRHLVITRAILGYEEAIELFEEKDEFIKVKLLQSLKEHHAQFSVYTQDNFTDLCRGPHGNNTKDIGHAFKLLKLSGIQNDSIPEDKYIQRITGTLWLTQADLDKYLHNIEEAQKRDHRKLAIEMDLYHTEEHTPGMIFWHPNGWYIVETLKRLIRSRILKQGYLEVNTPCVINAQLWKASGHWDVYKENMFCLEADNKTFALKPMSCPAHIAIFNSHFLGGVKSYHDLPLRIAEFGIVHRNEDTGGIQGLKRARCFTQDDGHIFCTLEQVEHEIELYCALFKDIYNEVFGFKYTVDLSLRPEKRLGDDATWDKAESSLANGAHKAGMHFTRQPGEGAFYGPKLDFHVLDCMERKWQCCTVQLDMLLPERLEATYIDHEGKRCTPVMIHRAVLGSIERFIAVLLEHYNGYLPFWLAPIKIVFIPLSDSAKTLCRKLASQLSEHMQGVIIDDDSKHTVGVKLHHWKKSRASKLIVVGDREVKGDYLTIQEGDCENSDKIQMPIHEAMQHLINLAKLP